MSEPIQDFSGPDPVPTARRGRPRSPETIDRDQKVMKLLVEAPRSREQLVEELAIRPQLVYLSLWRLRREGRVERVSDPTTRHLWRVVT